MIHPSFWKCEKLLFCRSCCFLWFVRSWWYLHSVSSSSSASTITSETSGSKRLWLRSTNITKLNKWVTNTVTLSTCAHANTTFSFQLKFQKSTLPPTVYSMSDPLHRGLQWDQPLPIWATATPVAATATASAMAVNGWEGPSVDANCHHDARFGRRSRPQPTRLADGTLVVPIADESDDEDIIGEEEEEELSGIAEEDDVATRNAIRAGRRIVVQKTAASEDGTSVISLSDKYRQQEEMDVFEEFYPVMVARPWTAHARPWRNYNRRGYLRQRVFWQCVEPVRYPKMIDVAVFDASRLKNREVRYQYYLRFDFWQF